MERILITGGAGFVGSNLALKLKEKHPESEVTVLDNLKRRGSELNLPRFRTGGIRFVHGDIRNREDFEEVGEADILIECSAEPSVLAGIGSSPDYLMNTNLFGTVNCLEFARKRNAKLIFLSTSRVYPIERINALRYSETERRFELDREQDALGASGQGIAEEFSLEGARSLYGTTKLCSEMIIQEYGYNYGLKSVINRSGVIAGPWQMGKVDQGVLALWVARHFYGGQLSYIGFGGQGKQVRDFLHIDDLFDLIDLEIREFDRFEGRTFNIGGGSESSASLNELTDICRRVVGKEIPIGSEKKTRPADLKSYVTDHGRITELCGWRPERNVERIVADVADWIRENEKELKPILS